ncbi:toll/interleukin-1 receptor domain-containing protein [Paenibacillus sp. FSL R5-0527]|uniref:toll/interleukin-1 receptor domain-containing protein n=1 Tax=Paenibacillus sp. FSL R5-0527 TaxID=2975321 RepID=UPI00097B25C2|nr:hypothetical protein BK140_23075 [Paenibacillus macerans]
MNKPTIFFSHSSKDRDLILAIKTKLDSITGGVLEIFLSSDGQSIPFGSNWVHKIEDGLKQASVMFVFVTPNSIATNWIYFEAGFAYSKGIEVIPVGIGIDIALLKAPLSLLQGFNITSGDGLNNFISVINKKFDYRFEEKFSDNDYTSMIACQNESFNTLDLRDVFDSVYYELLAEYGDGNGGKITYNVEEFFENITVYLTKHNVKHSYEFSENQKSILVYGIKIVYKIGKKQDEKDSIRQDQLDKICFTISPYNFEKSYDLFVQLAQLINDNWIDFRFSLRNGYAYITREEHLASVMSVYPDEFGFAENRLGSFSYREKDMKFSIYNLNKWELRKGAHYVLNLVFNPQNIIYRDIQDFVYSLVEKEVIYKV